MNLETRQLIALSCLECGSSRKAFRKRRKEKKFLFFNKDYDYYYLNNRRNHFDKSYHRRNIGALLLEVAIVISVIGMIAAFFVSKTTISRKMTQEQVTKQNIEIVASALSSYLSTNKRLPSPAISNGNNNGNNSGLEGNAGSSIIGYVPYSTLGIAQKNTTDGQGRPLIYIVEPALTAHFSQIYDNSNSLIETDYFCKTVSNPKIKIAQKNGADAIVSSSFSPSRDIVAFVLDTTDNPPTISSDGSVIVHPSAHTAWFRRDFLLIHYLKGCPCENETPSSANAIAPFPSVGVDSSNASSAAVPSAPMIDPNDPFGI